MRSEELPGLELEALARQRERVKRRLVADLVEENLALAAGRRSGPARSRRPRLPTVVAGFLVGAVLGLLYLVSAGTSLLPAPGELLGTAEAEETGAGAAAGVELEAVAGKPSASWTPAEGAPGEAAAGAPPAALSLDRLDPIAPGVFPLAFDRVVLDPGHGGSAPGTVTPTGLEEKELTLDIGLRLRDLLVAEGFEVVMTREEDVDVELEERARIANEVGGDLFVSIHVNWIGDRRIRGVETYYLGPGSDSFASRLAARENRGAAIPAAEVRRLLDEIYLDFKSDTSRRLAGTVQRSLYRSLEEVNPGLEDRGVKSAPFLVLARTEMPAILAEVSCLSNRREAELLSKPLYRQYIAEALADGLTAWARGHHGT